MRPRSPAALRPRAHAQEPLFRPGDALDRLTQDLVLERFLAQEPLQLPNLLLGGTVLAGTTSSPAPAAVSAPCAISLRQVKSWLPAIPCRRATSETVLPGRFVSSTIRTFSSVLHRRRR